MRVLLVSLNREAEPFTAAPLGLALVASSLELDGHEVRALDLLFEDDPERAVTDSVFEFAPELVGLSLRNIESSTEFLMPSYRRVADAIMGASPAPIVIGGPGFSVMPRQVLEYLGVEYGIKGEAERAVREFTGALEKGLEPSGVPGVCTWRDGSFLLSPPEPFTDLDGLPACTWDKLYTGGYDMAGIQSKRGCSFSCAYCTYPALEGNKMRLRSPDAVAHEVEGLVKRGMSAFYFVDNVFNNPRSHALEICSAIVSRGVYAHWGCLASPLGLDVELLAAMKEAGCESVEIGADSLSDRALAGLGKPFGAAQAAHSVRACKSAGMPHMVFLILGGPGEDEETLKETFDALDGLEPDKVFAVAGIRVYPDTPIHRLAVESGMVAPADGLLEPRFYVSERLGGSLHSMAEEYFRRRPGWIYYRADAVLKGRPAPGGAVSAWDESATECLRLMLKEVPVLLRPIARKAVTRKAGALAQARGRTEVTANEVAEAFIEQTPGPFRVAMQESLRKFGYTR